MDILFSSNQFSFRPKPTPYYREEVFVSPLDANRVGLSQSGEFGVLSIEPLYPGPPPKQFGVRIVIDNNLEPGGVHINQGFLDSVGLRLNDERFWDVKRAPLVTPLNEAIIELVVEQGNLGNELESLKRQKRDLFLDRCLLVEPGQSVSSLSLSAIGRGYFNLRSIQPAPENLNSNTLLIFGELTKIVLFVPHRKSGVDMVIVIDASGSMDFCDYVGTDSRVHSRLDGVRNALEVLFQRRLVSGSRVARIAAIVFGANTRMLYPLNEVMMVELKSEGQLHEIRASARNLSITGLERLKIDRSHTDISGGLKYAAELLDYYSQEGNEKVIVLLSDGADWTEDTEIINVGEIVGTSHDPAALADSLHFDSQIRIHTVAISDEQAARRYLEPKYLTQGFAIPNTKLLERIADITEGLPFQNPDARILAKLFDEIGEGAMYPL